MAVLGVRKKQVILRDFETRNFPRDRQAILEFLYELNREFKPDVVFTHTEADIHQDHDVLRIEALRTFRGVSVLGYDVLRSSYGFFPNFLVEVTRATLRKRLLRWQQYKTYADKYYFDRGRHPIDFHPSRSSWPNALMLKVLISFALSGRSINHLACVDRNDPNNGFSSSHPSKYPMTNLFQPGRIQLRGRIRWQAKRLKVLINHGPRAVAELPIVFGNAIPKCGSKLLFNILRSLESIGPFVDTGLNEIKPYYQGAATSQEWIIKQLDSLRSGDIRFGYLNAIPEYLERLTQVNWASFFIIRDPRDQIISEIYYALQMHKGHTLHHLMQELPNMQARIDVLTREIDNGPFQRVGVFDHYARFSGWIEHPDVCVLRFEDLIRNNRSEIERIISFLERKHFRPSTRREHAITIMLDAMAPKKSETYRQGKTGGWRDHFNAGNIDIFKELTGDLLVKLGYENSLDW